MRILVNVSFFLLIWLSTMGIAEAQERRSDPNAIFRQDPSSRDPEPAQAEVSDAKKSKKTSFKKSYNRRMDEKKDEFEERMEDNAKKYKKRARKMEKPQYSDPSYFGHKRKPKKRPVGKRKLCKECGIVH